MKILGVHFGHNATVSLMVDGELVFCMSEERLNRLKNSNGMPVMVLDYVYKNLAKPEEIDLAVISQQDIVGYVGLRRAGFKSVRDFGTFNVNFSRHYSLLRNLVYKLPGFFLFRSFLGRAKHLYFKIVDSISGESLKYFSRALSQPKEKILFCNHHAAHAYAACLNLNSEQKTLVFTMDGEGDGLSSTVNTYYQNELKTLSTNPVEVSIGYFFTEITKLLGMIPNEHEFKVMGLAPYAKQEKAQKLYKQFEDLIVLDDNLHFQSKIPTPRLEFFLLEKLYGQRFDTVAAFAQIFLEEKVLEWVKAWIKKTGIHDLALSGGVFMSVKLNQKILELPEVESLYVMPSGADESTAVGTAFFGYLEACKRGGNVPSSTPIKDLYLGKSYSSHEIKTFLEEKNAYEKYDITESKNEFETEIKVAKLLADNQVVARMAGRSEWGARALGNRSILANPSSRNTVKLINEMIKNRDFWMPFAASVLEEDASRYLKNPKNIPAPYMAITFETTELAQSHLTAAIHPYDYTCRPQIVIQSWNTSYYRLIAEFKKLTGIGGVLNTSFNLHGEPNVETPADALRTFENSGLQHLALENFLISKK